MKIVSTAAFRPPFRAKNVVIWWSILPDYRTAILSLLSTDRPDLQRIAEMAASGFQRA
jgi:hypothetical protein